MVNPFHTAKFISISLWSYLQSAWEIVCIGKKTLSYMAEQA